MGRIGYSAIKLLGIEGKKVNIIPTNKGMNFTELKGQLKIGDFVGN